MSVVQRKAILKAEGFFPHKKNAKGTTIIYSRNHPTAKFVRVVVDSGIDSKTNKIGMVRGGKVGVKLCYINRQKQWREITTEVFTTNTGLVKTIRAQEAAEKFVKTCKFCKAKKFAAKSGNVVCANACWTKWGGKKKSASPKKKSSQKIAAQKTKAARQKNLQRKKTAQKMTQRAAYKSSQKSSQKKLQKIVAEILPGDLVTVEQLKLRKLTHDYTGSILGIVMKVDQFGKVDVNWTANTSNVHEWEMPFTNHYTDDSREIMRFKVLSRDVEWTKAA
tara:strand:+ start:45 stop:875 length:831 start_codon:yes stop_codon:yes gene_type:complete